LETAKYLCLHLALWYNTGMSNIQLYGWFHSHALSFNFCNAQALNKIPRTCCQPELTCSTAVTIQLC